MPALQNLNYFLSGKITSLKGEPLNGLTVRAYDKDPVSPDDALGSALTDEAGLYSIQFTTKNFQTGGFERSGPDVYISVFSGEDLLGISKIQKNSLAKITIDLKVDNNNIKKDSGSGNSPPSVDLSEKLDTAKLKRLDILTSVTTDAKIKEAISNAFKAAQGDWSIAKEALKQTGTDEALLNKFDFINSLADVTNDKQNLVNVLVDLPGISNLRDLALTHNAKSLADILENNRLSKDDNNGKTDAMFSAKRIMQNVFSKETSAVLQRMANTGELPIDDKKSLEGIDSFLANQPDFNIRTTSIYNALKNPEAFKGIEEDQKEIVTTHLKTLQRVQAISASPEAVTALIGKNINSAQQVANISEKDFVNAFGNKIGEGEAIIIHEQATNTKIKNEQSLQYLTEWLIGTGVAAIDGTNDIKERIAELNCCLNKLYKLLVHNKEMLINCENIFVHHAEFRFHQTPYLIDKSAYFKHVLAIGIDKLFEWARPVSAFDASNSIANSIRLTMKAKYNETDWEQVVKPLHDKLSENQRNALISYLLQQLFTFSYLC
jgi:hypothetical protein